MITENFAVRHIGPRNEDVSKMLEKTGCSSISELIDQTAPHSIRLKTDPDLPTGMNELEYLNHLRNIASSNRIFKTYIGLGYYNTITPGVIQRNVLENPGWYTSYTPYQAEISQGRLEALMIFQTMVSDLTALPLANASLLDEGTAAAEAMLMLFNARSRDAVRRKADHFFVSDTLFPQTLDVLRTRAIPLNIKLVTGDPEEFDFNEKYFGALVQYPDQFGEIHDHSEFTAKANEKEIPVVVAADLLSLTLLTPPGEWGAEVVVGSTQRFGIPMGFGGPHAAYFATIEKYKRNLPGRIIGGSLDAEGNRAYRMALQTREQHIKRERATSNICTAQALLASMAGMYALYHGPRGLRDIALDIHRQAQALAKRLIHLGYKMHNKHFFDTLKIGLPDQVTIKKLKMISLRNEINLRYIDDHTVGISLDETTSRQDVEILTGIFASAASKPSSETKAGNHPDEPLSVPDKLIRKTAYLEHEVFHLYHSETEMMRFLKKLENKDLALNRTMIPLGSCTMKLNAAAEMFSLSWPEFGMIHPFAPEDQAEGYMQLIKNLEKYLCEITGFSAISFQPNSGASGEYTGLLVIREFLKDKGQGHRDICLIPSSAHGTNPASSVMAGLEVVVVKSDEKGNIDIGDLKAKAEKYSDRLAALMVTYPSTHGVFEEGILEVIETIHAHGGQVYMDGANLNAQVGLTNPALIGADVCHLNLHKTFAIPHGGGGPGVGPIGVAQHLVPYLPGHTFSKSTGKKNIGPVSSADYGSALILPISYGYIRLMGAEGLKKATEMAILNTNYLKSSLEEHYKILYTGKQGRVAHEMILDCNEFSKTAGITVVDIAKRLMDYCFHAPTVAFPVHGTLMVEPTESESLQELDRFIKAMVTIRKEIREIEIEEGKASRENNLLKNAPHTLARVASDKWELPYSREKAAFSGTANKSDKYWTPVARIDDAYGDRNLACTCYTAGEMVDKNL